MFKPLLVLVSLALLNGCAAPVVVGAAAAGGAVVASDERTPGTLIDDQGLELKVGSALADDDEIAAKVHVSTTVVNARALLTGEAPSAELKARSGRIAARVKGVERVFNELLVGETSGLGSRSKDTWITTKVKAAMLGDDKVQGLSIKVVTERGIVYLMGLVSREQGDAAAYAASQVSGVKRVVKLFEYQ